MKKELIKLNNKKQMTQLKTGQKNLNRDLTKEDTEMSIKSAQ